MTRGDATTVPAEETHQGCMTTRRSNGLNRAFSSRECYSRAQHRLGERALPHLVSAQRLPGFARVMHPRQLPRVVDRQH